MKIQHMCLSIMYVYPYPSLYQYMYTNLLGPRDAVAEADDEEERAGEGLLEELAHLINL